VRVTCSAAGPAQALGASQRRRASNLFRAGRRLRRLWVRLRWLLLLQLLLPLLLLFLLCHVMTDHAARRGTRDGMMPGNVPGHTADDGPLDTALRRRAWCSNEKCDAEQRHDEQRQFRLDGSRHVVDLDGRG